MPFDKPVLHAERIYVQHADLIVAEDVVHFHVESMSLLLKHVPLCSYVLKLVRERLCALLQDLVLQQRKTHGVNTGVMMSSAS